MYINFIKIRGIFLPQERGLDVLLCDGASETYLLAKKLGVALYTDEPILRIWAAGDGVEAFRSLVLFKVVREEGRLNIDQETEIIAVLIKKNFNLIAFGTEHLNSQLEKIYIASEETHVQNTKDPLISHETMGTLLRRFGDSSVDERQRVRLAMTHFQWSRGNSTRFFLTDSYFFGKNVKGMDY